MKSLWGAARVEPALSASWLWSALAIGLVVAAALRVPALFDSSFDLAEIRLLSAPPEIAAGEWETRSGAQHGYQRVLDFLWVHTLSEGWVRTPGLVGGTLTLIWVFAVLWREVGLVAGVGAVWIWALLPVALRSSIRVDPAAWAGLAAVAALWVGLAARRTTHRRKQSALLAAAVALLAHALWINVTAWWVWAALSWKAWTEKPPASRQRGSIRVSWATATVALVLWQIWLGLPKRDFFFFPFDRNSLLTWWGLCSPLLAGLLWAIVLSGFVAVSRNRETRWLAAASLAALTIALVAHRQRWGLGSAGMLLLSMPPTFLAACWLQNLALQNTAPGLGRHAWMCVATLVIGLAVLGPGAWREMRSRTPNWRLVAATLHSQRMPGEILVPVACRDALVFYEPELAAWAKPDATPAAAVTYFPSAESGWLVAPAWARLFAGWSKVTEWAETFHPVDASPEASVILFRYDRRGPDAALRTLAYQNLPSASLARGTLLRDILRSAGAVAPVLWKVDQVILDPAPRTEQNPALLEVVTELAQQKHGDRAASLALHLAKQFPNWGAAGALRAAFQSPGPAKPTPPVRP